MGEIQLELFDELASHGFCRVERMVDCVRTAQALIGPSGVCDQRLAEEVSRRFGMDEETGEPVLSVADVLLLARGIRHRRAILEKATA